MALDDWRLPSVLATLGVAREVTRRADRKAGRLARVQGERDDERRGGGVGIAADRDLERERDRELVARAQAGDGASLGVLLTAHGPTLYRSVLLPRLGSEAAAHDALAETYEKVLAKLHTFTWQNVGFYPWLRTVALRVALDHLRARKRMVVWGAEDVEREVDATATSTPLDDRVSAARDAEAVREKLHAALSRIHPRYAEAIRLRVLEELPREEVAARLGATPATFDVLLHRATAALKKALETPPTAPSAPRDGSLAKDKTHGS
ncbi:MAG: RNA polymerase sigma factor [Myxococcales bacterium]|jgi:RNA polymerase sigma-70 factor (ECF subfamily)|nr:RNA polymerase sigma factor [Myxococcales bacterium]